MPSRPISIRRMTGDAFRSRGPRVPDASDSWRLRLGTWCAPGLARYKTEAQCGEDVAIMEFKDHIRDHMPVVGSDANEFATVDHLDDGDTIKLTRDENGKHHWIPLAWVVRV